VSAIHLQKPESVAILLGNSDDKLSQREWMSFIKEVRGVVGKHCDDVFFDGGTAVDSPWQSACIVASIYPVDKEGLLSDLTEVRRKYLQDSIAVVCSEVQFV